MDHLTVLDYDMYLDAVSDADRQSIVDHAAQRHIDKLARQRVLCRMLANKWT